MIDPCLVAVATSPRAGYGNLENAVPAPELPGGAACTVAQATLRELLRTWGLDAARFGHAEWNPLGGLIDPGARVLLKPNWVSHRNEAGLGLECLVTHPSLIEALVYYVHLTRPAAIVIGDAPIQGCRFDLLMKDGGFGEMETRLRAAGIPLRMVDFRRTILHGDSVGCDRAQNLRRREEFVEFDLGADSLLEPVSGDSSRFRVAMYNPDLMGRNHAPGRHRYLVTREVIDADVVISLPKLKTHKKACLTGALKNLVGINGNKEYLPHYRVGRDGYESSSLLKDAAERLDDVANRLRDGSAAQKLLATCARVSLRAGSFGGDRSFEGSWWGNDTIWRTCLDLQRVALYGRPDGALADAPQRRLIAITDAIVGGEGDGPLCSSPISSGFLTAGLSMPVLDWAHCRLMGFDPDCVPLVREAFGAFRWPIAGSSPERIHVRLNDTELAGSRLEPLPRPWVAAPGWRGRCEASA